jgi:hypothetical protein
LFSYFQKKGNKMTDREIRAALVLTKGDVPEAIEMIASGSRSEEIEKKKARVAAMRATIASEEAELASAIQKRSARRAEKLRWQREQARRYEEEEDAAIDAAELAEQTEMLQEQQDLFDEHGDLEERARPGTLKSLDGQYWRDRQHDDDDDDSASKSGQPLPPPRFPWMPEARPLEDAESDAPMPDSVPPQQQQQQAPTMPDSNRTEEERRELVGTLPAFAKWMQKVAVENAPAREHFSFFDMHETVGYNREFRSEYGPMLNSRWVNVRDALGDYNDMYTLGAPDVTNRGWYEVQEGVFTFQSRSGTGAARTIKLPFHRHYGILVAYDSGSGLTLVRGDMHRRYVRNRALMRECLDEVARQIPEVGRVKMGEDGKKQVVREAVVSFEYSEFSRSRSFTRGLRDYLEGMTADAEEPNPYPGPLFVLQVTQGKAVFTTNYNRDLHANLLANNVIEKIGKVIKLCLKKQFQTPFSSAPTRIAGVVQPLGTTDIDDRDYLPEVLWNRRITDEKAEFRASILGHIGEGVLRRMPKYSTFDYLQQLKNHLEETGRKIYMTKNRQYYIDQVRGENGTMRAKNKQPYIAMLSPQTLRVGDYFLSAPRYPFTNHSETPVIVLPKPNKDGIMKVGSIAKNNQIFFSEWNGRVDARYSHYDFY